MNVVCCQVEVSASGRPLVQRSPTEYGVSECDLETSTMRWPRPIKAVESSKQTKHLFLRPINEMSAATTVRT